MAIMTSQPESLGKSLAEMVHCAACWEESVDGDFIEDVVASFKKELEELNGHEPSYSPPECCPICGSERIATSSWDPEGLCVPCKCKECGGEWHEVYQFSSLELKGRA